MIKILRSFFILITLLFSLSTGLFNSPVYAINQSLEGSSKKFINSLSDQALQSLTKKGTTRLERIRRFRSLFKNYFAVGLIGKWVLGRYWRQASIKQQDEYLKLFEDLIVVSYVDRFAKYTGTGLKITKSLALNPEIATVYSLISNPKSSQEVRVNWRVRKNDKKFKIVDVVVEGTSMSITMKSDFGSIIRQNGGKISNLISVLRAKTTVLKKEVNTK